MAVLETDYEKKSFAITTVLFLLLFLFMLLFIIYPLPGDELVEHGGGGGEIAINFGNSVTGSGDNYKSKDLEVESAKSKPVETQQVKEILTQNTKDAPAVAKINNPTKTTTPKVVAPVKPKTSKAVNEALSNLLNGNNKGDGNDKNGGNKGKNNGDPNSTSYNGNGKEDGNGLGKGDKYGNSTYGDGTGIGTGKGSSWGLKGRKLATASQKIQDCNEYGVVVVKIFVNKQGNVIRAERSQGTTNTDPCLVNPAIATAKSFKWQADNDAPETQIGFIVVNFKLGE
jgi:outer membrane biosynthesis protein TonB